MMYLAAWAFTDADDTVHLFTKDYGDYFPDDDEVKEAGYLTRDPCWKWQTVDEWIAGLTQVGEVKILRLELAITATEVL